MNDRDCVQFLQWCLPRLGYRWAGFRRVRRQVCRRVTRRIKELELADVAAYQRYLTDHQDEWPALDSACRVTISRFYRDRGVFDAIVDAVIPATRARLDRSDFRIWSVGCCGGEEPYTLTILWNLTAPPGRQRSGGVYVLATDTDANAIARGERGVYPASALEELPDRFRCEAFIARGGCYHLREPFKTVEFRLDDVRETAVRETFDLILCRNLVFTYFDDSHQIDVVHTLRDRLRASGLLVVGTHETLPPSSGFTRSGLHGCIWRRDS